MQLLTKAWTAGLLNALGDGVAQKFVEKNDSMDLKRLGIFAFLVSVLDDTVLPTAKLLITLVQVYSEAAKAIALMIDSLHDSNAVSHATNAIALALQPCQLQLPSIPESMS